jgi:hypothetical protein
MRRGADNSRAAIRVGMALEGLEYQYEFLGKHLNISLEIVSPVSDTVLFTWRHGISAFR